MNTNWANINNQDEKALLKTIDEYNNKFEQYNREFYTDFYDTYWVKEVLSKYVGPYYNNSISFIGGYQFATRQMVAFIPFEKPYNVPISILKIEVKLQISESLTHRDFLGSLLGLGIERKKIGDIIIKPFGAYIFVHKDICEFIKWNLIKISKYTKIEIMEIEEQDLELEEPKFKEISGTVSSLRVDAIFSLGFKISRTTVNKLLQQDKGKCNGVSVKASSLMKEGDIGSLRGYGKIKLQTISGKTKKDRTHVSLQKYM